MSISIKSVTRREALRLVAVAGAAAACQSAEGKGSDKSKGAAGASSAPGPSSAVLQVASLPGGLAAPWPTPDPFLFCVHHDDKYPVANDAFGPAAPLDGRDIGQDFAGRDGWNMYHGRRVPGFPAHPHRGFETVTVVRTGLLDHSDSLGAAARYGEGDVQWLTAGAGIQHAEMFPLLDRANPNPVELFQIWLNLPAVDKMAPPHFSMLWSGSIPRLSFSDEGGRRTDVTVVAGTLDGKKAPSPPPRSYASRPEADVAIWPIKMAPGATWTMPPASPGLNRWLYVFLGNGVRVEGQAVANLNVVKLRSDVPARLQAGSDTAEFLLLQGKPIGEPVSKQGPFVMNSRAEIVQAYEDYQRTRFGGWPWDGHDPVHGMQARFARHADGTVDKPA